MLLILLISSLKSSIEQTVAATLMAMWLYQELYNIFILTVIVFSSSFTLSILSYMNSCLYLCNVSPGSQCAHRRPDEMANENSTSSLLSITAQQLEHKYTNTHTQMFSHHLRGH